MRDYSKLSSEELLNLPPGEFLEFTRKQNEKYYANLEADPDYLPLNRDEKIKYFAGVFGRLMRSQAESGLDPYNIFDKQWYDAMKRIEPDFDSIMDEVFEKYLSWDWSKEEYLKRITQDPI